MNSKQVVKFFDTDRAKNHQHVLGLRLQNSNNRNVLKGLYGFGSDFPSVKFLDKPTAKFKLPKIPWLEQSYDSRPDSPRDFAQTSARNAPGPDSQRETQLHRL